MKKHIVILTGAGMSAESGIATFRDSGGLWENHKVEDVATPEGFRRNPQLVLDFYNGRRRELLNAKPNRGHELIAGMEKDYNVTVITQNVDNLHEKAGSSNVVHLHGELMKVRSTGNPYYIKILGADNIDVNLGDKCPAGYQLRPHIVWFGEAVPMIEKAAEIVSAADIMVVIGTSLNVYPAAGLLDVAPRGIPLFLIDPKPVGVHRQDVRQIQRGASEGMAELVEVLRGITKRLS